MRLLQERLKVSAIVGALVVLAACVPVAVGVGVGVTMLDGLMQASPTVNDTAYRLADRVADRVISADGHLIKIKSLVCALPAPVRVLVRSRVLARTHGRVDISGLCDEPAAPPDPEMIDQEGKPKIGAG